LSSITIAPLSHVDRAAQAEKPENKSSKRFEKPAICRHFSNRLLGKSSGRITEIAHRVHARRPAASCRMQSATRSPARQQIHGVPINGIAPLQARAHLRYGCPALLGRLGSDPLGEGEIER
jgi:hypothetical protein